MKKVLFNIILLLIPIFVMIYSISKFDNLNANSKHILNVNVAGSIKNLDYIFVGPSYVYSGINPVTFDSIGKETFNLGVATAGPAFSELIIDDYIKASGSNPKNILLAVSFSTFSEIASDAWDKYPIHRYLNFPLSNEYIFSKYVTSTNYIKLLRNSFKSGVSNLIFPEQDPTVIETLRQIRLQRGYSYGRESYSYAQYQKERKLFLKYKKSNFSYSKESKFLDLINKYKKAGINLIVIEPPTFRLSEFYNNEFKVAYEGVKSKLKELKINIIENKLEMDSTCFGNLDHMNNRGAAIYSKYLIKKLHLMDVSSKTQNHF